jgi:hypothetical protein
MSMLRPLRSIVAVAITALALAACGGPPAPEQMAAEVTGLGAVVPILEELQVTDFEASPFCRNLAYARGTFGDLSQDGCARDGSVDFDAAARDDHERLARAVEGSAGAADRIRLLTYDAEGRLSSAWFVLTEASTTEDLAYLYDPSGEVAAQGASEQQAFTRIDGDWWFVRSYDD